MGPLEEMAAISRFLDDQITYYYVKYQLLPPSALAPRNARKCTIAVPNMRNKRRILKNMYFSTVSSEMAYFCKILLFKFLSEKACERGLDFIMLDWGSAIPLRDAREGHAHAQ